MFTCEMSGCEDMITSEVRIGSGQDVEIIEVCSDCADYWRRDFMKNGGDILVERFPIFE